MTHRYGENVFRLFRLPAPREEQVVGILGPNGMGKSTAVNLLAGTIQPNLGDWTVNSRDWSEVLESFPRGELRDYLGMVAEEGVSVAVKPQYIDKLPKIFEGDVRELLERVDDRGELVDYTSLLAIDHVLDRKLGALSGGELQRVALCATLLKEADVYFFDEPSSYLDIHERIRMVRIIQNLAERGKRVLVVEHDLAILDVLCDLLHVVYGERAAYGIFTPPRSTRTAINAYLDGFLPEENIRIRDKPIQFLRGRTRGEEVGAPILKWGGIEKTLGDFHLKTGEGEVKSAEVVGVVGPQTPPGRPRWSESSLARWTLTKDGVRWMPRCPTSPSTSAPTSTGPFKTGSTPSLATSGALGSSTRKWCEHCKSTRCWSYRPRNSPAASSKQ